MSSPESVSSRIASFGSSTAIWRISLRFFSPPEKPALTKRDMISGPPLDDLELLLEQVDEVDRVDFFEPLGLPDLVVRRPQEVGVGDAGDLDRVLEGQEHALLGPLFRLQVEQVLALVGHLAAGDRVRRVAGQHLRQRALARPVGPHDGVHFAGIHREADTAKDLPLTSRRGQVPDLEHAHPTLPSSETPSSFWASTANSIGSSLNTSLQKPFTMSEMAFSVLSPRCLQ